MDRKIIGIDADHLKRRAKKASKALGITHTDALNLVAKEHGFTNWDNLINNRKAAPKVKVALRRPAVPTPAVLNYHNFMNGAVLGQHPNRKMPVRRHAQVGGYLQELLEAAEYHKRAKKALHDIRITLDTWLASEYSEAELDNSEFNGIYYGNTRYLEEGIPSLKRQAELKRKLRAARYVLDRCYHDCKPLDKLHQRFNMALKALEKWPLKIKSPGNVKGRLTAGKFVRIDHSKQIGIVFHHDTRKQVIEGYSDGGHFLVGRHEVTVLRKQPKLSEFKPMRISLPYGKWTSSDGTEVLFNRDYSPIWERPAGGSTKMIAPETYVNHDSSEHYYDDRTAPYYGNADTLEKCHKVLEEWGVAGVDNRLVQLMPAAIAARDFRLLSPKGSS
jgi:hypothetical protein